MLIRIVQLTIRKESVRSFLDVFAEASPHIRAVPGCQGLELGESIEPQGGFATISRWDSPEALERYRSSEFFRENWSAIKPMFAAKPQAFSYQQLTHKEICSPACTSRPGPGNPS